MTKISIYNASQFTSKGKLKKNAKTEFVEISSNGLNAGKTSDQIKRLGFKCFETPYIFTHIKAVNKDNEPVMIFQDFMLGNDWIITSPQELLINLV